MGMVKAINCLFTSHRHCRQNSIEFKPNNVDGIRHTLKISIDTEVDLIKALLEKKFNRKFQMRVKVEGYLKEEMKYRLVVDDYCTNDPCHNYHSIYGYETRNILDVKKEFLNSYWDKVKKVIDSVGKTLDKWDIDRIEYYKDIMVASSREELLIHADLEGLK